MIATPAIRNLIREGKTHQIPSFMQAGGSEGMLAFDQHLAERVREGLVTLRAAPRAVPLARRNSSDSSDGCDAMPATKTFHYNSIDATGKQVKGKVEAANEAAATQHAARSAARCRCRGRPRPARA